jgi:hypothetical protein
MKTKLTLTPIRTYLTYLTFLTLLTTSAFAQPTAFTYQGRLLDGSNPANGSYDFEFTLYDTEGGVIGRPLLLRETPVTNGLFTVALDFRAGAFTGADRWLGISVNGSVELSPRTQITAAPYAVLAANVAANSIGPSELQNGAVTSAKIAPSAVGPNEITNSAISTSQILDNSITSADVVSNTFWQLDGNSGTTPGTQFLGTADNQPLEFKVNGRRALRLEPTINSASQSNIVNVIGGSPANSVLAGVVGATIAGGGAVKYSGQAATNRVTGNFGTVGGGARNTAGSPNGEFIDINRYATVGGGHRNISSSLATTVGGGELNIASSGYGATVAGGSFNESTHRAATVAGGQGNKSSGDGSFIGGGFGNQSSGAIATVGAGGHNIASGYGSVIAGGGSDFLLGYGNIAAGGSSFIGGGFGNRTPGSTSVVAGGQENEATNDYAVVPGGLYNMAGGRFSFAAGHQAKALHHGSFVWADDSASADFVSTTNNQFNIRAVGGVRLSDNTPGISFGATTRQMLDLWHTNYAIGVQASSLYFRCNNGSPNDGFIWYKGGGHANAYADPGGGTELMHLVSSGLYVNGPVTATAFNPSSDRNLKENFAPVSPREVLDKVAALPITRWNFKGDDATPHLGPMAQDFHAAFNVGTDNKHIATVDADGVALAAIQGLHQIVKEKDARISALEKRLEALEKTIRQEPSHSP